MEDNMLKRKIDETLTLGDGCNLETIPSKSSKLKTSNELVSSLKSVEPSSNDGDNKENPSLDFACKYCDKKFTSSQALGGHQNAHKQERFLKKEKEKIMYGHEFGARFSTITFPSMCNNNYYQGSSSTSHLGHGVQLHNPMAQMLSMSLPHYSSLGYSHLSHFQGLKFSNTPLSGHQFRNYSSSFGGGAIAPRFNLQGVSRFFHGFSPISPTFNNVVANQNQGHAFVGNPNQNQGHAFVANPIQNHSVTLVATQASNVSHDAPKALEEIDLTLKL